MVKHAVDKAVDTPDTIDKLVAINRTAKVVKGGKRFGFSSLVIVGDGKGRVGFGKGKAKEVTDSRKKATDAAKKSMIRVPLREGRTLHHDVRGEYGSGRVILRSASPGTGIIAGGPMRAIFEALGVQDIVAKSVGNSNPYNMVRATFAALENLHSPRQIASRRGKKVSEIVGQRETEFSAKEIKQKATSPAPQKATAKKTKVEDKKDAKDN